MVAVYPPVMVPLWPGRCRKNPQSKDCICGESSKDIQPTVFSVVKKSCVFANETILP